MGEDLIGIEPFFNRGHVFNGPRIKIPSILEILITYSGNQNKKVERFIIVDNYINLRCMGCLFVYTIGPILGTLVTFRGFMTPFITIMTSYHFYIKMYT